MPKLKTKKGAQKRFSLTKTGKLKRGKTGKRHILTKKSKKRKRDLSKSAMVDKTFERKIKRLLPYA
ncbi:MAG: 50S ribosomal protein L35 [Dehalococcoidia bacterium]|nr:MAG: 50S ribosomal protein L35 [Dehalococcoidia bacterium]